MNLLAIAIAPGLAIAFYVYWHDRHEKEPLSLVMRAFFLGVISTLPAGFTNSIGVDRVNYFFYPYILNDAIYHFSNVIQAFFIVGSGEELFKFLMLFLFLYPRKEFNEPYDGILYGAMVAIGFATLENIQYVMMGGMETAIARMFTAVPMHASAGIIMGYFVGMAKFSKKKNRYLFLAWAVPALLHGFYDYFLFVNRFPAMAIGALASLVLTVKLAFGAIKIHRDQSPFKP
ncbi:MAG: RsiW-degrading membrane proteinase PrsW (M82 family) [Patiriisocius sp.]|jgi:RsiW-degrading membrane proteinase PrsW (M82 family)